MTSNVLSPKRSTMYPAVFGPMPLIVPEAKYFKNCAEFSGIVLLNSDILNCLPKLWCDSHRPVISTFSPGAISGRIPTHVTSSPLTDTSITV